MKKLLFRALRDTIVTRMYYADMSWATINKTLKALGQLPICELTPVPDGKGGTFLKIEYGQVAIQVEHLKNGAKRILPGAKKESKKK